MTAGNGTLRVALVGVSHWRAPLVLRECLAFPPCDLPAALQAMRAEVPEAAILSTCHRVELYAAAPDAKQAEAALKRFWSRQRRVPLAEFEPHAYSLSGRKAAEHLFSVAAGLDSAIIGEPQILGQVREVLRTAAEERAAGPVLSALFRHAITAGRRARAETAIGRNAASLSSAAVRLARELLGDLTGSRVLLVGSGKMGALAARNLIEQGVASITVVGRRLEKAERLALRCGHAMALSRLEEALPDSDIVISCTSAPHPVVRADMVKRAMQARRGRPLLLIDIAVPRDIEAAAGETPGVRLYNVDDLEATIAANVRERKAEARKVAPIIEEELAGYEEWLAMRRVTPTIAALKQRADTIRRQELERTAAVLGRLPEDDRRRIEALALAIQKKLLHQPIALLRRQAASGDGLGTARAVHELFGLEADAPEEEWDELWAAQQEGE